MKKYLVLFSFLAISTSNFCQEPIECNPQQLFLRQIDNNCFSGRSGSIIIEKRSEDISLFQLLRAAGNIEGDSEAVRYEEVRRDTRDSVFSQLESGKYKIIAMDSLGGRKCYRDVSIKSPARVSLSKDGIIIMRKPHTSMNRTGILEIPVSGGTPPYQLYIRNDKGSFEPVSDKFYTKITISNLIAGTYEMRVNDANGCFSETILYVLREDNSFDYSLIRIPRTCDNKQKFGIITSEARGDLQYTVKHNDITVYTKSRHRSDSIFVDIEKWGNGNYILEVQDERGIPVTLHYTLEPINCKLDVTASITGRPDIKDIINNIKSGQVQLHINSEDFPFLVELKHNFSKELIFKDSTDNQFPIIRDLTEGIYELFVTDRVGRVHRSVINIHAVIMPYDNALKEYGENLAKFKEALRICDCNIKTLVNRQNGFQLTSNLIGLGGTVALFFTSPVVPGIIAGSGSILGLTGNIVLAPKENIIESLRTRRVQLTEIVNLYDNFSVVNFNETNWNTRRAIEYEMLKDEVKRIESSFDANIQPVCKGQQRRKKFNLPPG